MTRWCKRHSSHGNSGVSSAQLKYTQTQQQTQRSVFSGDTYTECTDMHMCSTNCYKHNVVSVHQIGVIRGTNILAVAIVIMWAIIHYIIKTQCIITISVVTLW